MNLDTSHYPIFEGWKRYEISNHLGNVLAVVTDRKRGKAATGVDIQWFEADVMAAQQYYPFGMLMPGNASASLRRQYTLNSYDYRYGFNGKEGDDEVKGDDNQQDYGMRIYDPRVGRFLSVDPIASSFPWNSVYAFAENSPIAHIDLDGEELVYYDIDNKGVAYITGTVDYEVIQRHEGSGGLSGYNQPFPVRVKNPHILYINNERLRIESRQRVINERMSKEAVEALRNHNGASPVNFLKTSYELTFLPDAIRGGVALYNEDYQTTILAAATMVVPGELDDAAGKVARNLGPLKNRSGSLDDAANLARNQPYGGIENAAKGSTTVLEGAVRSNYSRFASKIPANSKASASFQLLDDGNYLFQATSPGKVPGSSALYQKWVTPQGETFKMIKTTFAPDGSIIHVKPKF